MKKSDSFWWMSIAMYLQIAVIDSVYGQPPKIKALIDTGFILFGIAFASLAFVLQCRERREEIKAELYEMLGDEDER